MAKLSKLIFDSFLRLNKQVCTIKNIIMSFSTSQYDKQFSILARCTVFNFWRYMNSFRHFNLNSLLLSPEKVKLKHEFSSNIVAMSMLGNRMDI